MASLMLEEYELRGDSKYRQYISAVDKALKSFEGTSEWADLISALGKLNKVLVSNIKYPVIPSRIVISKRLAQCMHPALPSGVHLKALECYDIMFKCMGTNRLSQELFIYSAGLFPLFGHAAMNVRPALLTIYETHFVPLGRRLRPGLRGFLSGILPGLDEGSDHFDRTGTLIQRIAEGTEIDYFFGCLWDCVLCNPAIRLPAITFTLMKFNKKLSMEDQLFIMGTNVDVTVGALCAAVQDSNVLVQRYTLELLLAAFPMHNSQLTRADLVRLMTAAVTVLLRRDMSLNRRLYSWLLGSEVDVSVLPSENPVVKRTESVTSNTSCDQSTAYFDAFSRPLAIDAITNCLRTSSVSSGPDVRPYRIIISLLDKPEIGPPLLDYVMIEVLRALYCNYQSAGAAAPASGRGQAGPAADGNKQQQDLVKTANLLFGALEPHYVWDYMKVKYGEACRRVRPYSAEGSDEPAGGGGGGAVLPVGSGDPDVAECCALIVFLLDVISTETSVEVQTEHLPHLVCCVVQSLSVTLTEGVGHLRPTDFCCSLDICRTVLNKVQPGVRRARSPAGAPLPPPPVSVHDCARLFAALFAGLVAGRLLAADAELAECRRRLELPDRAGAERRDAELRQLLQRRAAGAGAEPVRPRPPPSSQEQTVAALRRAEQLRLSLAPAADQYLPAFRSGCQLLVLLSSFPAMDEPDESPPDEVTGPAEYPEWLVSLLAVACFLPADHGHSRFVFSAVSTLLDLVALASSLGCQPSRPNGGNSVAVRPLLTCGQQRSLVRHTVVAQLLTRRLWRLLSPRQPALHLPCVDLLQLMLNLLPSALVENQLTADMTHPDLTVRMEAFGRFAVLWHLSREVSARRHISRSFDRCLLLMLDCLRDTSGPLYSVARTWLTHTLQRGDVTRIMEPLLLLLLTPDTARVSVQHIDVSAAPADPEDGDDLGRVYAISSVEGNVIYHVADESAAGRPARRPSGGRKLLALTSLGRPGGVPETRAGTARLPGPHDLSAALLQPISVFVNPITAGDSDGEAPEPALPRHLDLSSVHRFSGGERRASRDSADSSVSGRLELADSDKSGSLTPFDGMSQLFSASEESVAVAAGILGEIVDAALDKCNLKEAKWSDKKDVERSEEKLIHPLHSFMLLYCQVCDSRRILYALQTLRSVLETDCRLTLCSMATTSVCSSAAQSAGNRSQQIQVLLSCHRRSMQGRRFGGEPHPEALTAYRSSMLLEVVMAQCLQFIRSYYPNLEASAVTAEQLQANRQVQIVSAEILTAMFSELVTVVRSSGRSFATYLADLLKRCKVQKTLLNCLLSTVHSLRAGPRQESTLTEDIMDFNEVSPPAPTEDGSAESGGRRGPALSFTETLQIQLIRLVLALLILEDQTDQLKTDVESSPAAGRLPAPAASEVKFYPGQPVSAQPMLLNAITGALKQSHTRHLHRHWLSLVTSSLPFVRRPLPQIVTHVVTQVVQNIEQLAALYQSEDRLTADDCVPPDHMVYLVEALTVICHFCMIDSNQQVVSGPQPVSAPAAAADALHTYSAGPSAPQVLSNLLHVFAASAPVKDDSGREASSEPVLNARRLLLSVLPRIMVGTAALWHAVTGSGASESSSWILGVPRVVKQQVLELLSPISHHHPASFLAAVAVAWHERRLRGQQKQGIPEFCPEQLILVELVASIRVIPIDSLVQTVRSVVRQPPSVGPHKPALPTSALQFLLCYLRSVPAQQLAECWSSLLVLLRDAPQLAPPAQFLLLAVLNEYVQRAPPLPEKKDQRDLQDVAAKLVEACSAVAGACLEQTTWLRRNLAVRAAPGGSERAQAASPEPGKTPTDHSPEAQWSVQALRMLAELLAPLLDVLYQSDEKDRVLPLLNGVMCHVTPYLKNHSPTNAASFLACSQLLASLSEYQYSRRAWRREAFDLLLEPAFFSMQAQCLPFWRTTIDNMMTHDKTTFKELLARVVVSQPGSLNLFSSRDAEYELRAQLLKRLAFVVFCSDEDQYQPHLPELQEKLAESLRLPQVAPSIQSAVLLCFRVLLLRMSARHVVSLWPSIITEMVQVFLQIEHQLSVESEEFSQHIKRLSGLDSSWVLNSSNGLAANSHPGWLQLHLEACKLLDMCLTLPAHRLPQFQMYRWAFVGSGDQPAEPSASDPVDQLQPRDFVPHVTRLTSLVLAKCRGSPPPPLEAEPHRPLLHVTTVRTPADLYPFFVALGGGRRCPAERAEPPPPPGEGGARTPTAGSADREAVRAVEAVLAADFLEPLGEQK